MEEKEEIEQSFLPLIQMDKCHWSLLLILFYGLREIAVFSSTIYRDTETVASKLLLPIKCQEMDEVSYIFSASPHDSKYL